MLLGACRAPEILYGLHRDFTTLAFCWAQWHPGLIILVNCSFTSTFGWRQGMWNLWWAFVQGNSESIFHLSEFIFTMALKQYHVVFLPYDDSFIIFMMYWHLSLLFRFNTLLVNCSLTSTFIWRQGTWKLLWAFVQGNPFLHRHSGLV